MSGLETILEVSSRQRAEAVLRTLGAMRSGAGTLAEVAHDTRNMIAALSLYCDLLAEPGVLGEGYSHYAAELRLIVAASRRLIGKLTAIDAAGSDLAPRIGSAEPPRREPHDGPRLPGDPIENLQQELLANRNLLDAVAGLGISVTVRTEGGARSVRLAPEDLTRVLVNLVKNAAEAMHSAGQIEITLRELPHTGDESIILLLLVEDSGPGIPNEFLEQVFEPAFTTHAEAPAENAWPAAHRGLGLSIARSIIEAAGGRIEAANRPQGGASMQIELPARTERPTR